MLWRPGYTTREMEPASAPPILAHLLKGQTAHFAAPFVLLGGFDLSAFLEIGVWRRLIEEAAPSALCLTYYFVGTHDPKVRRNAEALTPLSQRHMVGIAEHSSEWKQLIQPDKPNRSFATIVNDGFLDPLMVGVPTEESWDRFKARLEELRAPDTI